jgi:hypothetical protein
MCRHGGSRNSACGKRDRQGESDVREDGVRDPSGGTRASYVQLRLLGRFAVAVDESPLAISRTGQRLLARVALNDGSEDRGVLAGALWPEHTCSRAQANLRGAVWRLPAALHRRLVLRAGTLAFDDGWDVETRWSSPVDWRSW